GRGAVGIVREKACEAFRECLAAFFRCGLLGAFPIEPPGLPRRRAKDVPAEGFGACRMTFRLGVRWMTFRVETEENANEIHAVAHDPARPAQRCSGQVESPWPGFNRNLRRVGLLAW